MDDATATVNESPAVNVSPERRSMVQRTNKDRHDFYLDLVRELFGSSCSCDECSAGQLRSPKLLCVASHKPDEIVVQPGCRPGLISDCGHGIYNAIKLARSTIAYFRRSEDAMDSNQRAHEELFKILFERKRFMEKLGTPHPSELIGNDQLSYWVTLLKDIFFFGALENVIISWWDDGQEGQIGFGDLGNTMSCTLNGERHHLIRIHARSTERPKTTYPRAGATLAEERLGTILHELLHAFLDEFSCRRCPSYFEDLGHAGHGRAWQLVAKAIEEQTLRLLGTEVYLGRLAAYTMHRQPANQRAPKSYTPSVHDLVSFGFLEL
jgi:hypothetical protein